MFYKNNTTKIEVEIRKLCADLSNDEVRNIAQGYISYTRRAFDLDRLVRTLFLMMLIALPVLAGGILLELALPEIFQSYAGYVISIATVVLVFLLFKHQNDVMLKEYLDAYIDNTKQAQQVAAPDS